VVRRRDPHLARVRRGREYRIQFSWTSRPISGGGSGGGSSLVLARMNSGTGERLSAMPQPASAITAPAINAE
jgi:hypothetical protein